MGWDGRASTTIAIAIRGARNRCLDPKTKALEHAPALDLGEEADVAVHAQIGVGQPVPAPPLVLVIAWWLRV